MTGVPEKKRVPMFVYLIVIALLLPVAGLIGLSLYSSRPVPVGVVAGRLRACPDTPNVVSSQAEDSSHWIAPLVGSIAAENVISELRGIVESMTGTNVVTESKDYLHVEFRSSLLRFVDDVEFLAEPESGRVHVRSASRVGHSDMGANRTRVEEIRRLFADRKPSEENAILPTSMKR